MHKDDVPLKVVNLSKELFRCDFKDLTAIDEKLQSHDDSDKAFDTLADKMLEKLNAQNCVVVDDNDAAAAAAATAAAAADDDDEDIAINILVSKVNALLMDKTVGPADRKSDFPGKRFKNRGVPVRYAHK